MFGAAETWKRESKKGERGRDAKSIALKERKPGALQGGGGTGLKNAKISPR